MGRDASKAKDNPWYQARMRAAAYDERLKSREGAAELLGMSVSSVVDAELGLSKVMPPDKACQMAELYNAPQLLNYYCLTECPIGRERPLSDTIPPVEQITVKLIRDLRLGQLEEVKDRLVDIAADGKVSPEEKGDLKEIVAYFEGLSRTISELLLLGRVILGKKEGGPA